MDFMSNSKNINLVLSKSKSWFKCKGVIIILLILFVTSLILFSYQFSTHVY